MILPSLRRTSLMKILTVAALWSLPLQAQSADLAGCEANLKKALCYSDAVTHWAQVSADGFVANVKRYQDRKCLPAPEEKFKTLIDLYGAFPIEIQKSFCEMKRVFLVRGAYEFGAVAEYYFDTTTLKADAGDWSAVITANPTGYILEIGENNRFIGETASDYLSRVFQARFGQQVAKNGLAKDLPLATYNTPFGKNGALATTIVHEIGHMLSRAQRVTDNFFLTRSPTPWTKFSWNFDGSDFSAKEIDADVLYRINSKTLKRSDLRSTMRFLKKSGIPTLYAATSVEEEFAEQFMFNYYDDVKWMLDGEVVLDLQAEFKTNPVFKAKRDFIRKLMSEPEPFSLKKYGAVKGDLQLL